MKKIQQRILDVVKRMAYQPTRAERVVFADVVLQQMTAMLAWDKHLAAVALRKSAPGFLLAYNAEKFGKLTPGQMATVLAHECQHIRRGDVAKTATYVGKEYANGWKGPVLFNVARDCQINDELYRLGFAHVEGSSGEELLERNTEADDIDALMAEIAEKVQPPPEPENGEGTGDQGGDLQADKELEAAAASDGEGQTEVDVGKMAGKQPTKGPARVKASEEQARWDNFLATVLDTKQSEDRWHQQPKRMSGVGAYVAYEATLPRRHPLPRKTALMAIDVSGSMDARGVERICNLVRNSPANYQLTVICFDTGVDEWKNFRTNDEMPRRGGGTDFHQVEHFAKTLPSYPDAILCITDGEGTIPEVKRPGVWTWVLYNADVQWFSSHAKMRAVDLNAVAGGRT